MTREEKIQEMQLIGYYLKALTARSGLDLSTIARLIDMKAEEVIVRNQNPPGQAEDDEGWRTLGVGPKQKDEDGEFLRIAAELEMFMDEEMGVSGDELILMLNAIGKVLLFRLLIEEDAPSGMPTISSTLN